MDIQVLDKPTESEQKAQSLEVIVSGLSVVDQKSYDLANVYNAEAMAAKKAFHEFDDPVHDPITDAWKKSCARRKKIDDACNFVIKETGLKCGAWMRAEQERAAEEKRKAEEIARKVAEDAQLRAAQELHDIGLQSAADAILDAPVVIQKVESTAPQKAEGVSYIDRYSVEVTSLIDLAKAVVEGKAPLSAICADESWLGQWARLTKGSESIAGVKVVKTTTQSRRM
jgi:hypothetical protein